MRLPVALSIVVVACGLAACGNGPPQGSRLTEQQSGYVNDLNKIDGRLGGDQARSLQLGTSICAQIAAGKTSDEIAGDSQRFTQGEGTIDRKQAAALVEAARKNLCP
jgi:hypothetical protein